MRYCNQGGGQQGWGMNMPMGGYNADTWDGEFEHLRKKMKERMKWMDQQLGFTEPAQPIVTEPIIHVPDWPQDTISKVEPPPDALDDFSRLSPTNFFNVNGDKIEIQTDLGGTFALIDLNGVTLFKTRIKKGTTTLKVPEKAQNQHWIATLNGKMLSR